MPAFWNMSLAVFSSSVEVHCAYTTLLIPAWMMSLAHSLQGKWVVYIVQPFTSTAPLLMTALYSAWHTAESHSNAYYNLWLWYYLGVYIKPALPITMHISPINTVGPLIVNPLVWSAYIVSPNTAWKLYLIWQTELLQLCPPRAWTHACIKSFTIWCPIRISISSTDPLSYFITASPGQTLVASGHHLVFWRNNACTFL